VYALGCVLYFLLCARPPFAGRDVRATLLAHIGLDPEAPSCVLRRVVPRPIERVVMRCLQKDPAARYTDGAELATALSEAVEQSRYASRGERSEATIVLELPDLPPQRIQVPMDGVGPGPGGAPVRSGRAPERLYVPALEPETSAFFEAPTLRVVDREPDEAYPTQEDFPSIRASPSRGSCETGAGPGPTARPRRPTVRAGNGGRRGAGGPHRGS